MSARWLNVIYRERKHSWRGVMAAEDLAAADVVLTYHIMQMVNELYTAVPFRQALQSVASRRASGNCKPAHTPGGVTVSGLPQPI